jgi:hypothetical protein
MIDYPKEHQPALAKERKPEHPPVAYCIGADSRQGFDYGPFTNINDALEVMPLKSESKIFISRSAANKQEILYTWNDEKGKWILNE